MGSSYAAAAAGLTSGIQRLHGEYVEKVEQMGRDFNVDPTNRVMATIVRAKTSRGLELPDFNTKFGGVLESFQRLADTALEYQKEGHDIVSLVVKVLDYAGMCVEYDTALHTAILLQGPARSGYNAEVARLNEELEKARMLAVFGDWVRELHTIVMAAAASDPRGRFIERSLLKKEIKLSRRWDRPNHRLLSPVLEALGISREDWEIGESIKADRNMRSHGDCINFATVNDVFIRDKEYLEHAGNVPYFGTAKKQSILRTMRFVTNEYTSDH